MARRLRQLVRLPRIVWESSLPLRIIAITLSASVVVLALGGWLILRQASSGILEGKRAVSVVDASAALQRMEDQLRETDLRTASLFERLNQLADEASSQGAQYQVMIEGPVSNFISRGLQESSVPEELRVQVGLTDGLFVTPTLVDWTDPARSDLAGLAIGGRLNAPSGEFYPIYFVFPLTSETATLDVLKSAVWSTELVLVVALGLVAWVVSQQVTNPIREASGVARRIAAGDLDERVPVRGTDDLASLATSLNSMATELQQQIDQLADLSRVQQRFVSDVSHELRTPLTTVRMASDLLHDMREDFDPTAARTTELLHDAIERFQSLLADLLEISRFDAGAAELVLEQSDIVKLVQAEIDAQQAFAEHLDTPLRLHAPAFMTAEVDTRRIRRIMRNLIANALEHGEGEPIDITVGADEHTVAVTVRDHGVGFEPAHSQLVFHRFWRADPSRRRTLGGSGLGLSIAMEDARLHGGWLQAWGRPRQGALFRLTVPRTAGDPVRGSALPLRPPDVAPELSPVPQLGSED